MPEFVDKELCDTKFKSAEETHALFRQHIENELKRHQDQLTELRDLCSRLTIVVERLTEINARQDQELQHYRKTLEATHVKKQWFETDIGVFAIKACIIALLLCICSAIGFNALEALKAIK